MKKVSIIVACVIAVLVLAFFLDAALVWLAVWALKALGVTSICGWTVAFSWPLVILVMVITVFLSSIFKTTIRNKN